MAHDGGGGSRRTGLAAFALLHVVVAAAVTAWKLQRPAASGRVSLEAASVVARRTEERTGHTLGEVFEGLPDRTQKGSGSRFDNWMASAIWNEPFKSMPFTPALTCEPGHSVLMSRFDWKFVPGHAWVREPGVSDVKALSGCRSLEGLPLKDNNHTSDPRTVWAAAYALPQLLEAAEAAGLQRGREGRAVVFFGNEMPLSKAFGRNRSEWTATVDRLRKYFGVIAYQIKDVELEHVRVAPMGLCWGYVMLVISQWIQNMSQEVRTPAAMARRIHGFDAAVKVGLEVKEKSVLAVSGYVAGWLDNAPVTRAKAARFTREGILFPPSNSSVRVVLQAVESRERMRRWLASPAAVAVGVNHTVMPATSWWQELARYRFLINPIGSAIQTAKTIEALMVLTLPIVQRMGYRTHDELVAMGFPLVVVDSWFEITPNATARWWERWSPRLESFRRNCLTTEGYWRMFTGRSARCS